MATKFSESVITAGNLYAGHSPAMSLNYGGMSGVMPRYGGYNFSTGNWGEWIANSNYVRRNVIPIVLQTPRMFDYFGPNEAYQLRLAYKNLIEILPFSFDGLQSGLTVETDEHAVGGAGEMQEEPTNVVRARTSLSFTYREKLGRAINKYLNFLIRYGIMDPDTKIPLIRQYLYNNVDVNRFLYTPDLYTGTAIFIEPDITHLQCLNAWLCTNMFNKSDGEVTGKRDIHSGGELVEYSIEFSSITINTDQVRQLGQALLNNLTVLDSITDNDLVLPAVDLDSEVRAVGGGINAGNQLGPDGQYVYSDVSTNSVGKIQY